MPKKILLINSDLAKNRGDRAIAEGLAELIKSRFPDAAVTGLSEHAERDRDWFGIDFLSMDSQSLNPLDFLRLLRAARRADLVLWGGGEILKDYTNKLALWYWTCKITAISLINSNIYGAYQGIGPTSSASSRRLIAFVVRRCRLFIVRDDESRDKLIAWGVRAERVIASSDPAVLPSGQQLPDGLRSRLSAEAGIDEQFLGNFVCFGPRGWFHYKTGGIIPFKYKKRLLGLFGKNTETLSPKYLKFRDRLVEMADDMLEISGANLLLVPMHMSESDSELCSYVQSRSAQPERVRTLNADSWSPTEIRDIMGQAKAMVGFRLHSTIIATSSGVPSINIYYVDKGRLFFEQIGQSRYSLPIDDVLSDSFPERFGGMFDQLLRSSSAVQKEIEGKLAELRESVRESFGRLGQD